MWYLVQTDYNSDPSNMGNFCFSQPKRVIGPSSVTHALSPVVPLESYCPAARKNCPLTHLQYCHNRHSSEPASPVLKEQSLLTSLLYLGKKKKEMSDSQKMVCIRSNSVIFLRASKGYNQGTGTVVLSDVMISKSKEV